MEELTKGWLLGFAIAAPVGPIGLLCIRRTLADGFSAGLASGLGAATADAAYGVVAALGLTAVSAFVVEQSEWLRFAGGLFLLYLGVTTFLSPPAVQSTSARGNVAGLASAYGSTLALTLTNPATILSFGVAFAGLGLVDASTGAMPAGMMVVGVLLGSACWWLLLCAVVGALRDRVRGRVLVWINRFSGVILAAFGVVALATLLG